jgi:cell division protein FtsZ
VHPINVISHDAGGVDAEIIFGAVHERAMQGEIRVTVIATGFDRALNVGNASTSTASHAPSTVPVPKSSPVIPFPGNRPARVTGTPGPIRTGEAPRTARPNPDKGSQDLSDMEIPTFIRRQMD